MQASISVENNLALLPVCLAFVESFAALRFQDQELVKRVVLTAEEAFCYAVETAYEPDETGTIKIVARFDAHGLKLAIQDWGLPFDKSVLNDYDPAAASLASDLESLGLFLIQRFADQVKWEHMGAQGNLLSLFFNGDYKDVTELAGGTELKVYDKNIPLAPEQEYIIRLARPDEAIHISRCLYRSYGYTYLNEDIYYPEKISRQIETKNLISAVAVSEAGEIIGHCSLSVRVPGILVESGQAVIDPRHRGRKLFEKMKDFLTEYAVQNGFYGISSEPVTNHTRSQKTGLKTGNHSCGLMLGYLPSTLTFRKMEQKSGGLRRSCVYNYMPLKRRNDIRLSLNREYRDLVTAIYTGCGLKVQTDTTEREPPPATSQVDAVFLPGVKIGVITVKRPGRDCVEQIKQGLFHLTMRTAAEMVYLNLPLEDEGCARLVNRARELGFIFCAVVMALDEGRDMLRLQYINCDIDHDGIRLVGDLALEIYDFIRRESGLNERN